MQGLTIRRSLIEGAGRGLFATKGFKKNSKITPYEGEHLTLTQLNDRYGLDAAAPYALKITNNLYIDSALVRTVGAYANAGTKKTQNARLSTNRGAKKAWLVAIRYIGKGEEILIDYGDTYWGGERKATHTTDEAPESDGEWVGGVGKERTEARDLQMEQPSTRDRVSTSRPPSSEACDNRPRAAPEVCEARDSPSQSVLDFEIDYPVRRPSFVPPVQPPSRTGIRT